MASAFTTKPKIFGKVKKPNTSSSNDGDEVLCCTLKNELGMQVDIMTLGATITALRVPDRDGKVDDVVLGFEAPQQYLDESPYFGAIVGRYGNRIANGRFQIDDATYTLATNNGKHHLHGGDVGFDKRLWHVASDLPCNDSVVTLRIVSPDGEEGYPGTLTAQVTYRVLPSENTLTVEYEATTEGKPTVVNLTQHSYFNLSGHSAGSAMHHVLQIAADRYTACDEGLIPTGELASVDGTPMDFRKPTVVGARIDDDFEALQFGQGYDHNYVLKEDAVGTQKPAAVLVDPKSGRVLTVCTDEPGMQFYTSNFLDGTLTGKSGGVYGHRNAICLETQHFPDSPNQPAFPSTLLQPGEVYKTKTSFAFSHTE